MGYTSTEAGAVVAGIGGPEYLLHPTATGRPTVTTTIELRDPRAEPSLRASWARSMSAAPISCSATGMTPVPRLRRSRGWLARYG